MAHLIRQFLRVGYKQIEFSEAWLCPSAECHGLLVAAWRRAASASVSKPRPASVGTHTYTGTEFELEVSQAKGRRGEHRCEHEGCWHQLGEGHKHEKMRLRGGEQQVCGGCHQEAHFPLRAGGQFGWGNASEAKLMLRGIGLVGASSRPGASWER